MQRFFEAVIAPTLEVLRPKVLVEVGSLSGALTKKLIAYGVESGATIHSIDPQPKFDTTESAILVFHQALSHDALPKISNIDIALIDGDHNYYTVLGELRILAANAERDGHAFPVVMFHDVGWPYGRRDSYYEPEAIPVEHRQPHARKGMSPDNVELVEPGTGLCSRHFNAEHEGGACNGVRTAIEDFITQTPLDLDYRQVSALHGLGILYPTQQAVRLAPIVDSLGMSKAVESILATTDAERVRYQIRSQELAHRHVPRAPDLSIVVVMYNMRREAKQTLHSLTRGYQQRTDGLSYEVVVVDNGSADPLDPEWVKSHGPHFSYHRLAKTGDSPAPAINAGVRASRGRLVGIMIDGARVLSPGALIEAYEAARVSTRPVVATLAWHLGPEVQRRGRTQPYDQRIEDELLRSIRWPEDGYRLFDISVFAGSSSDGHFGTLPESNFLVVARDLFDEIGGFDERFKSPGGGLVNLEFYARAASARATKLLMLLGEGSFHQIHGGVTTGGGSARPFTFREFAAEYRAILGVDWQPLDRRPTYYGMLHPKALPSLMRSMTQEPVASKVVNLRSLSRVDAD